MNFIKNFFSNKKIRGYFGTVILMLISILVWIIWYDIVMGLIFPIIFQKLIYIVSYLTPIIEYMFKYTHVCIYMVITNPIAIFFYETFISPPVLLINDYVNIGEKEPSYQLFLISIPLFLFVLRRFVPPKKK